MPAVKRTLRYSPKKSKVSKRKNFKKGRKNSRKRRTLKLKGGSSNKVNSTSTESVGEGFNAPLSEPGNSVSNMNTSSNLPPESNNMSGNN